MRSKLLGLLVVAFLMIPSVEAGKRAKSCCGCESPPEPVCEPVCCDVCEVKTKVKCRKVKVPKCRKVRAACCGCEPAPVCCPDPELVCCEVSVKKTTRETCRSRGRKLVTRHVVRERVVTDCPDGRCRKGRVVVSSIPLDPQPVPIGLADPVGEPGPVGPAGDPPQENP